MQSDNRETLTNASTGDLKSKKSDMHKLTDSWLKGSGKQATDAQKEAFKRMLTSGIDEELTKRGQ